MRTTNRKKILSFLIISSILILLFFLVSKSDSNKDESSKTDNEKEIKLSQDAIDALKQLERQNLIRLEPDLNRAYIKFAVWDSMDAKKKENFLFTIVIYYTKHKGNEDNYVNIYDLHTAKKLAKFSYHSGFEVY